jgi:hypothetical protein
MVSETRRKPLFAFVGIADRFQYEAKQPSKFQLFGVSKRARREGFVSIEFREESLDKAFASL